MNDLPLAIKSVPGNQVRRSMKEGGQRWNGFLDLLNPAGGKTGASVLDELKKSQEDDSNLLWYPSAGLDRTDVDHVNRVNLPELDKEPKIFVHTDRQDEYFNSLAHTSHELIFDGKHPTLFYEKKNRFGFKKWVFHIQIDNFRFLNSILRYKIGASFLYTACDGCTTGMMGGGQCEFGISTWFLTRFYESLAVHYHITEYSIQSYYNSSEGINSNISTIAPKALSDLKYLAGALGPDIPNSFVNLQETKIESFQSATKHELVLRYCQS